VVVDLRSNYLIFVYLIIIERSSCVHRSDVTAGGIS